MGKPDTNFNIRLCAHCKKVKKNWCHITVQALSRKKTRTVHPYRSIHKYHQFEVHFMSKINQKRKFLDQNTVKFTPKNDKKVLALNEKTVAQAFDIHISPILSHRWFSWSSNLLYSLSLPHYHFLKPLSSSGISL